MKKPWLLVCYRHRGLYDRKVVFQPPLFRGYVEIRGCNIAIQNDACFWSRFDTVFQGPSFFGALQPFVFWGGGNSNIFISAIFAEMFQFDEHTFQMGWNHQLGLGLYFLIHCTTGHGFFTWPLWVYRSTSCRCACGTAKGTNRKTHRGKCHGRKTRKDGGTKIGRFDENQLNPLCFFEKHGPKWW